MYPHWKELKCTHCPRYSACDPHQVPLPTFPPSSNPHKWSPRSVGAAWKKPQWDCSRWDVSELRADGATVGQACVARTWVGVRCIRAARFSRSGALRYLCCLNRLSSSWTCCWVNRTRRFRLCGRWGNCIAPTPMPTPTPTPTPTPIPMPDDLVTSPIDWPTEQPAMLVPAPAAAAPISRVTAKHIGEIRNNIVAFVQRLFPTSKCLPSSSEICVRGTANGKKQGMSQNGFRCPEN